MVSWNDLSVTDMGVGRCCRCPFYDGFESGLSNWLHSSVGGGHQRACFAGGYAVHDTPTGLMPPSTYLALELNGALNLTNHPNAQLTFWLRGHLNAYSAFRAQVSTDGGLNWADLRARSMWITGLQQRQRLGARAGLVVGLRQPGPSRLRLLSF